MRRDDTGSDPLRDDPLRNDPLRDDLVTIAPSSDGVSVAVHHLGGTGHPAVLAHATGFNGPVWAPFASHLHGYFCVAPDLRGHGLTVLPPGVAIHWDGFADDVTATVDALDLKAPVGIGHSKGGAALLRAEARRPGTFSALWVFEPIVFPPEVVNAPQGENPLAVGAERRRTTFESFDEAIANFASKPPLNALHPASLEAYVRGGFSTTPDGSVHLRCEPAVEASVYRTGSTHDTFEMLDRITIPVTVVTGAVSEMSPAMLAGRLADQIPGAELVTFEDLGHFGPLEDPERMAAHAVSTFDGAR